MTMVNLAKMRVVLASRRGGHSLPRDIYGDPGVVDAVRRLVLRLKQHATSVATAAR
jgi:hypothetical protein